MMDKHDVEWASKHDWFIEAIIVRISGKIRVHVRDDMVKGNILGFDDITELMQWAAY